MKIKIAIVILSLGLATIINAQDNKRTDKMADDKTITLINPFEVPSEKLNETILMWEKARDFLQQEPGYISTALHQSLAPDARFSLINIAKWESVETFKAATKKMQAEANLPRIEGVKGGPSLYTIIRRD